MLPNKNLDAGLIYADAFENVSGSWGDLEFTLWQPSQSEFYSLFSVEVIAPIISFDVELQGKMRSGDSWTTFFSKTFTGVGPQEFFDAEDPAGSGFTQIAGLALPFAFKRFANARLKVDVSALPSGTHANVRFSTPRISYSNVS